MDYAKDILTGKIVNAYEVAHRRGFICPKCGKSVIHYQKKSAHGHNPHFAHQKGEATTDCENYHPRQQNKDYVATPAEVSQRNSPKLTSNIEDYSFHLEIVLTNPTLKTPHWYLAIAIAQTSVKKGEVIIKNGLWGEVRQPLSTTLAPIPIKTQEPDYQIEISGSDFEGMKSLPGLTLETGNLFTHKGDHGRRLANQKFLYWGEQYFMVWRHKDYQIERPSEIIQRTLIPQENWECVEIQLPPKPNHAISIWAQQYLGKEIKTPAIMLSLVTPPIYSIHENTLQIRDTDEVVVAITDPLGNDINDFLLIEQKMFQPTTIAIRGKSPIFIELGRLTLGETTLSLQKSSSTQLLVLNCIPYPEQKTRRLPSAIFLTFQNNLMAPAYSMKLYQDLQTRQHNILVGIKFPVPMRFWIRAKYKNDLAWQIITINTDSEESPEDFQNRAKQAIIEVINKQCFIQLDFGHFGQPFIQPPIFESRSKSQLPKKVVQQIQWLANLAQVDARRNQQASGEGMRMLNKISQGELKKHLQKMNRANRSAIAEPYLRVLAKKLKMDFFK